MLKFTPKHSAKSGTLPDEARKMEVNRFGCVDSTKVTVLSLVSKPDKKQSTFSQKLWEDWFEGEEPVRLTNFTKHEFFCVNCSCVVASSPLEWVRVHDCSAAGSR